MKNHPAISPVEKATFSFYDVLWRAVLPFLRKNRRLAEGFESRVLEKPLKGNADLWIQAASAGEAYLAGEIINTLPHHRRLDAVLTTNTRQGKEILDRAVTDLKNRFDRVDVQVAYCPFDMPSIMTRTVGRVNPRLMVLLETEIWPGLLLALKQQGCPAVIVNGRLTEKSLTRYMIWPSLWRTLRPERILAISRPDADRFGALFGKKGVATMPNIKFDRLQEVRTDDDPVENINAVIAPEAAFAVLGSVRREEENEVGHLMRDLHTRRPRAQPRKSCRRIPFPPMRLTSLRSRPVGQFWPVAATF